MNLPAGYTTLPRPNSAKTPRAGSAPGSSRLPALSARSCPCSATTAPPTAKYRVPVQRPAKEPAQRPAKAPFGLVPVQRNTRSANGARPDASKRIPSSPIRLFQDGGELWWLYEQTDLADHRFEEYIRTLPKSERRLRRVLRQPLCPPNLTEEMRVVLVEQLEQAIQATTKAIGKHSVAVLQGEKRLERLQGLDVAALLLAAQNVAEPAAGTAVAGGIAPDGCCVNPSVAPEEKASVLPSEDVVNVDVSANVETYECNVEPEMSSEPAAMTATAASLGAASVGTTPPLALTASSATGAMVATGMDLSGEGVWIAECLKAHNACRAEHGCPPLEWSKDCAEKARLCADVCMQRRQMYHCHCSEYGQGQNIFSGTVGQYGASEAIKAWYDELHNPGYRMGTEDPQPGTGHFSAVVWLASTHVGMNTDSGGQGFIVANYSPAGNLNGHYARNVLPLGSPMQERFATRTTPANITATELTPELEEILNSTPQDAIVAQIREHLRNVGSVDIEFKPAPGGFIRVKFLQPDGGYSCMSGSW